MTLHKHTFQPNSNILLLPGLFHETMDIIFESYEYFQLQDEATKDRVPELMQTLLSNEMSRITMRLTSVMAWLMARKAVLAGQLSDEEAADTYRIDGAEYCLEQPDEICHLLPDYLNQLSERSHALYLRVWRLDHQLYH